MIVRASKKRVLRLVQYAFSICAVLLLGYCGFAVTDTWLFQERETRQLELLSHSSAHALPPEIFAGLIGRIEIPRLDISVVVMEGSTGAVLRRAAGHIQGTALPGQQGNVAVSAHRDTFFRPLRNVRRDDIINFTTMLGNFHYRVVSTSIVPPSDVSVLDPGKAESLTLITCYPFYFIGSAPDRFIVRAERVI
jgi:sortase A